MKQSERAASEAPAAPPVPSPRRARGSRALRPRPPGSFLRSLSLSGLFHLGAGCGVFLVLLWFSLGAERAVERRDSFLASFEEPPLEPLEPEEEPLPEVEELEPEEEPELVEEPPAFDQVFPPEAPEPEPPDWLPPVDPFSEIDPEPWLRPVEPEPVIEPEPVVEPEPEPEPPLAEDPPAGEQPVPVAILNPEPRYPRKAVALGWEGRVRLRIRVDAEGKVIDVELVESTGHDLLDQAAIRAFRRWVFEKRGPGDPPVRSFLKAFLFEL